MTIFSQALVLQNGQAQAIKQSGGFPSAGFVYLHFNTLPSAGTVKIEGIRPGGGPVVTIYNGPAVMAAPMFDGGYAALRVTFTGLTGGNGATLSVVNATTAVPPSQLLTDGGFGQNSRIRVDQGQTGFFSGHMFRSFHEFSIPAGESLNLIFQSPVNFIVSSLRVELDQGGLKVENVTNPSLDVVPWTELPEIPRNRMTEVPQPAPAPRVQMGFGGTFTGGTVVDVLRIRTTQNQGNSHSSSLVGGADSERGLPPGNYIVRMTALEGVTEASTGVISMSWEERP